MKGEDIDWEALKKADEMGISGNSTLARYILDLEKRIKRLEEYQRNR